jgi:hypothetical protein
VKWPGSKRQLVEVEWDDSAATNGWQGDRVPDGTGITCRSVGYLVAGPKKARALTICRDIGENDSTGGWMSIPKVAIRRIKRLSGAMK